MRFHFRHVLLVILLMTAGSTLAQPQPPDFCFVITEPGNAEDPLDRPYEVKQHYQKRVFYYNSHRYWLKPDTTITLQSGDLFKEKNGSWRVFRPVTSVSESRILVIAGTDNMRIALPEDPRPLIERAARRWDRNTPEVIRFRKGSYSFEELIADPWALEAANTLAKRLIAAEDAVYRKQLADQEEYYRTHPTPPVEQRKPPPPPTEEEIEREYASRGGLREVRVQSASRDSVVVLLTGTVMLDGACANNHPLFGVEVLSDTGWVERIPFDIGQMDCGKPWAEWSDRRIIVRLAWWVGVNQPDGRKELLPGTYRLFFIGANTQELRTAEFEVE